MNRFFRSAFFPLLLVIVALAWLASETLRGDDSKQAKLTYSQVRQDVIDKPKSIESVVFDPKKQKIDVKYRDDMKASVHYPTPQSQDRFEEPSPSRTSSSTRRAPAHRRSGSCLDAALFILLFGFWIFLMNQVQGGGSKVMSFGKSRAKRMTPDSPKIGFKDVAGADEAVEELHEIKEFLENPKKFQALGARIPKACCSTARRAPGRRSSRARSRR